MSDLAATAEPVAPAAETSAPVTAPEPAEPPRRLTAAERKADLVARLRGAKSAVATAAEPTVEQSETDDGEPVPEESEASAEEPAQEEPKEEKKSEAERDMELELVKSRRALREAKADLLEYKPLAEEWKGVKASLEKAKGDPYAAVQLLPKLLGMDFGQLAEHVVKNADKYKQSEKYADVDPAIREEIELARKERAEREASKKADAEKAEKANTFARYETRVKELLQENSDEYPLVSSMEWTSGDIALELMQKGPKALGEIVRGLEKTLEDNLAKALGNERVVKTLLARRPDLKAKFSGVIATKSDKSPAVASQKNGAPRAPAEGPQTLTNATAATDTSAPQRRRTREERKAEIRELFKAHQAGR